MSIIHGVGIVVEDCGTILLGKRITGAFRDQWCLPGGKIESGEDIETCAGRELREETGLESVAPVRLFSVSCEIEPHHNFHSITFGTSVASTVGELRNCEPDKFAEWAWFPVNKLPSNLFRPTVSVLQAYFDCNELKVPRLLFDSRHPGEFVRLLGKACYE